MHQAFRVSVFTLILLAGFGFKSIVQSDGKRDGRRALLEDHDRFKYLGWFVDNQTYVELMMKEENNRWILRQRSAGSVVAKKNFQQTIEPNVGYEVKVNYDGVDFEVIVDGISILTMVPGAPVLNGVGFQSRNGTGTFAEIEVN